MSADGDAGELAGGWTSGRTALLIAHYDAGLSAAESAALIGNVSKSAVISKRRRLGLFAVADGERPKETRRPHWPRIRLSGGRPPGLPPLRVYPLPEMDLAPPPGATPKRLAGKAVRECAWPLGPAEAEGDYRTLFCCAPTEAGAVYCTVHAARAYRREAQ